MQRLRVLIIPALAAALATGPAGSGDAAAEPADAAAEPTRMEVGSVLEFSEALPRADVDGGTTQLMPRKGRPLALLFWGRSSRLGREALVELDELVREADLLKRMDVYAVGPYKLDAMKPTDLLEMARIDGVRTVPRSAAWTTDAWDRTG
jgi:hypothetical protein